MDGKSTVANPTRRPILQAAFALFCAAILFLASFCIAPAAAFADDEDDSSGSSSSENAAVTVPTVLLELANVVDDEDPTWSNAADAQVSAWTPCRATGTLPSNWAELDTYYYAFTISPVESLEIYEESVAVTLYDADGNELADLTDDAEIDYEDGVLTVVFDDLKSAIEGETSGTVLETLTSGDSGSDSDDAADSGADDADADSDAEAGADDSDAEGDADGNDSDDAASDGSDYTVQLSYQTRLVVGSASAGQGGGAETSAYISYAESSSDSAIGRSIESVATLYTWTLALSALDSDSSDPLSGAIFTIQTADGEYVDLNGTLTGAAVQHETDKTGFAQVTGLEAGTYTVTEVSAPKGYASIDVFTIVISSSFDDGVAVSLAVSGEDVQVTGIDGGSGLLTVTVPYRLEPDSITDDEVAAAQAVDADDAADDAADAANTSESLLAKAGDTLGVVLAVLGVELVIWLVVRAVRRRKAKAAAGGGK